MNHITHFEYLYYYLINYYLTNIIIILSFLLHDPTIPTGGNYGKKYCYLTDKIIFWCPELLKNRLDCKLSNFGRLWNSMCATIKLDKFKIFCGLFICKEIKKWVRPSLCFQGVFNLSFLLFLSLYNLHINYFIFIRLMIKFRTSY